MRQVFARLLVVVPMLTTLSGAAFSGDNKGSGRILLLRIPAISDLSALYSVNPDGSGLRRIAAAIRRPGHDADGDCEDDVTRRRDICSGVDIGRWSPDRKRVAFVRECTQRCYGAGLYVANADGSSARRLASGFVSDPDWSPDGRRIVFAREDAGVSQLYVAAVARTLRRLVRAPAWPAPGNSRARWSPNGRMISFVRRVEAGPAQVWVVRPDGGGKRRVATAAANELVWAPPDWSADSRWIAYMTEFVNGDVYLVRPNGTGKVDLTPAHDVRDGPQWAPVGDAIGYSAEVPCGMNGPNDPCVSSQIVVHRTRASPRERVDEDDVANNYGFAWSPDATRVAFRRALYADEGVFIKKIGQPGLSHVISGDWYVLDWALK